MILIILLLFIAPLALYVKIRTIPILILLIIITLFDIMLLWNYCGWLGVVCKNTAKISYRTFISLYDVMPEDFVLNDYDIRYNHSPVDFKTFIDVMRYQYFYRNIRKRQSQRKQIENQAKLIADLRRGLAREQAGIDGFVKEGLRRQAAPAGKGGAIAR